MNIPVNFSWNLEVYTVSKHRWNYPSLKYLVFFDINLWTSSELKDDQVTFDYTVLSYPYLRACMEWYLLFNSYNFKMLASDN